MDEDRKISFYSDAAHNYMVLECPPELKENYQYKMLAANRIKGLLSCSGRTIDRREYLYYDISSRQNLTDLYDRRQVRSADLIRILTDLVHVEETLTEYLLDTSHLILDPECVYMDFREQACSFAYYPGQEPEKGMEALFSFLADRVDGRDKQAAALIYRLCMMAEKPGFQLRARVLADLGMQIDKPGSDVQQICRRKDPSVPPVYDKEAEKYDMQGRGLPSAFQGYGNLQAETIADRNPAGAWSPPPAAATGTSGIRGALADPGKNLRAVPDRERDPDFGMKTFTAYGEREEDSAAFSDESRSERAFTGKNLWILVTAIILTAAGILLFVSDGLLELEESQMLLTRAFGGILTAAGVVILFLQLLRGRKKQDEDDQAAAAALAFTEPEPWEKQTFYSAPPAYMGADGPGASLHASVTQAPLQVQSFRSSVVPGETCLLGPDTRQAAGLYGTGTCRGEQISLAELPCVVGKMRDYVDQVLDDSSVSRMHARFSLDRDGKMTVRDLNSSNGTWLNGERLQPNESRTLQQGDHVRLGRMEFVFR